MDIVVLLGLFFLFCTVIFVFVAIFVPELVGITGKKAKEISKSQQAESPSENRVENPPDPLAPKK